MADLLSRKEGGAINQVEVEEAAINRIEYSHTGKTYQDQVLVEMAVQTSEDPILSQLLTLFKEGVQQKDLPQGVIAG